MKKHIASVHDGTRSFKCEICGYCFSEKSHLIRHLSDIHGKVEKRMIFECEFCGSKHYDMKKLKNHVATIHEGKVSPAMEHVEVDTAVGCEDVAEDCPESSFIEFDNQ